MSLRGEVGWQSTHSKAVGADRWPGLLRALRAPAHHVALLNRFLPPGEQERVKTEQGLVELPEVPFAFSVALPDGDVEAPARAAHGDGEGGPVPPAGLELATEGAEPGFEDRLPCYFLDAASVLAAQALGVEPGEAVLDLCAAPGGKSVVLATALFAGGDTSGRLVCNEPSRPRAQRLRRVLFSFLPSEITAAGGQVAFTFADASGNAPTPVVRLGPYDRILVDVPCTSDRHLVHQGKAALAKWASGAVKANAERQLLILQSAAALVKAGGVVLYCTCALAREENDGVVAKFLKKARGAFEAEPGADDSPVEGAEATEHGTLVLPDRTSYGPIYFARLRRIA